jgi:TRAP-type C4-dicarboxylate transport system substrate-binding protein
VFEIIVGAVTAVGRHHDNREERPMKMQTGISVAAVLVAAMAGGVLVAASPARAQAPIEVKISLSVANDPNHEWCKAFAAEIDARGGGKMVGRVFPAAQLGSDARAIEGVQLGTIEVLSTVPAFLTGLNPNLGVVDSPGLFTDLAHATRGLAYPKFRERYVKLIEDKGIEIFSVFPHSFNNYGSPTPIRKIDDFKGKKIRVLATKTELALMANYGATGTPITFSEVLPALQQRTVDAVRSSLTVMAPFKYFDVAKYATMVNDGFIPISSFVSKAFLAKISAGQRNILKAAAKAAEDKMAGISAQFAARAETTWKSNGGELIKFSDAEQKELIRRAQAAADTHAQNPATKDMYALVKEAAAATRK